MLPGMGTEKLFIIQNIWIQKYSLLFDTWILKIFITQNNEKLFIIQILGRVVNSFQWES